MAGRSFHTRNDHRDGATNYPCFLTFFNLTFSNCFPMMHANVGPTSAPCMGFSARPPTRRSMSSTTEYDVAMSSILTLSRI